MVRWAMTLDRTLRIAQRFCGPPNSGNGGYVSGHVASAWRSGVVRLMSPPPLETELTISHADGSVKLFDRDTQIAVGREQALALDVPPAPTLAAAERARARFVAGPGSNHPFPTCFVCGHARAPEDGLRIFPGRSDEGIVAAPFEPPRDLLAPDGSLPKAIVWAALDCPGYFAIVGTQLVPMLLGELAVEQRAPIGKGPHVVFAWALASEGRKARCGSALASPDGELLAVAQATWIRVRGEA